MTPSRRHLLVLAPQCPAIGRLERLEEAANALVRVMTDGAIGACAPGLSDGYSLLYGERSSDDLMARLREAIERAGRAGATLILALLGHGQTRGDSPTLYLMGSDSDENGYRPGIEVGQVLREAADAPGINGVIGIVDTCFALNAQPRVQDLAHGLRNGSLQLSLLMASSATERAFDLRLSRELAALLTQGLEGKGPRLEIRDVLYELRARLAGQNIPELHYDANSAADMSLWLARNVRYDDMPPEGLLGSKGSQELSAAWRAFHPESPLYDGPWDTYALRALERELAHDDGSGQWRRAQRAVRSAQIAQETVQYLRSLMERQIIKISGVRLRRALVTLWADASWPSPFPPWPTDVEAVDHVAFCHPDLDDDCRAWMARFVCLLVGEAGTGQDDPDLMGWARSIQALQHLAEALEDVEDMRRRQSLRLVVHLVSLTRWPQSLEGWLFWDGKRCGHWSVTCQTVDQLGTEKALREIFGQAKERATDLGSADDPDSERAAGGPGPQFTRVDIIVPSALLLDWHPEEIKVGHEYLGGRHDVITHWNRRFESGDWSIHEPADACLREISRNRRGAPLDWIDEPRSREYGILRERLEAGRYRKAVGLVNHPDTALVDLLLHFIPIVLWPESEAGYQAERHGSLDTYWGLLPWGFQDAYRKRKRGEVAGDLADLRGVWDDHEWLDFCRRFRGWASSQQANRERP